MRHAGHERIKPAMVMRLAGGERHRSHRAPVEGPEEADEVMALGVEFRQV